MAAFTAAAHATMLEIMPGGALAAQMLRLAITITISLLALTGAAQLLRIREYGEARDLILGRLKRMAG
jgi:hypothetical protein